jgi:hypothetical protein
LLIISTRKDNGVRRKGSHDPVWQAIQEILRYLLDHPDAVDTMEGIMKWWLPEDVASSGKDTIKGALDTLVSSGWVIETSRRTLPCLYGLTKGRQSEIAGFLEQGGPNSEAD